VYSICHDNIIIRPVRVYIFLKDCYRVNLSFDPSFQSSANGKGSCSVEVPNKHIDHREYPSVL